VQATPPLTPLRIGNSPIKSFKATKKEVPQPIHIVLEMMMPQIQIEAEFAS
jgi:hypothetical protein